MMSGADMRKENSAAFSASTRPVRALASVIPERLTPGRSASAWAHPMKSARFQQTSRLPRGR